MLSMLPRPRRLSVDLRAPAHVVDEAPESVGMFRMKRLAFAVFGVAAWLAAAPAIAASMPTVPALADRGQVQVAPTFHVVVVDDMTVQDLKRLAPRAAIGLLVPGAGPSTNRHFAKAGLVRGLDINASLGRSIRLAGPRIWSAEMFSVPHGDDLILVALPASNALEPNDRRYPIAVVGNGFHGLLTSPTTRIPGLVSIADVAPTAIGLPHGALGHVSTDDPVLALDRLDHRIHANNRLKLPVLLMIAGVLVVLSLLVPTAAVPAILAALLTSIVSGAVGVSSEPLLVTMVLAGTLGGGAALGRVCSDDRRLLTVIVGVLLLHVVLLVARPAWVAITPLGPTQNSRFWGIGNQLETLLLAPVVVGASLAVRRYGLLGFSAFAALALVLITDNRLGSDGGGAIVFGVALAFVGARSRRLGLRGFVGLLGLAAIVILAVIALNLRAPGPDHLRSAFSSGLAGVGRVIANRVPLAYVPALHHAWLFAPLAVVFATSFALAVRASSHRARDLVLAAGLALATSLLVNDSAVYEVAAGVAVVTSLSRFSTASEPLSLRAHAGSPDGSPVARSAG
jgi:hypothetical protein